MRPPHTIRSVSKVKLMSKLLPRPLCLLSALAVIGCGSDAPELELEGALWTIDSYIEDGLYETINLEYPPTIQFEADGGVQLYDACNTGFGAYEVDGSMLTFTAMGTTLLACNDELVIEAGEYFWAVVSAGESTFVVSEDQLTLMRGSVGLSGSRE